MQQEPTVAIGATEWWGGPVRRALSLGTRTALADCSLSILLRASLLLIAGCVSLVIACADDDTATDAAPERNEQLAAVEVEQEQERSSERQDAAPASATNADASQETQSTETQSTEIQASAEPTDSEPPNQPETRSANEAASQSRPANPPAEASEQDTNEEPSAVQSEPEAAASQAQPQQAAAQPEAQSEPESEPETPAVDNDAQKDAEESHVAQAPATDADVDTEEEPTSPVVATPVASNDNVGGSSSMTANQPGDQQPLDVGPQKGSGQTVGVPVSSGTSYTWQDGEYTRTVTHMPGQTATARGDGGSESGPRQAGGAQSDSNPVFQTDTGQTMTLPGGVLLVLEPEWGQARIDKFFKDNNVDRNLVQERTFTTNAYFIETEPGFPSLNLANELAGQEGVVLSSPNWQTEVETQ